MKIHFVMHESFEAPGAILEWLEYNNFTATYTRLYKNEAFPSATNKFDFLIVMGGPQSPATTLEECSYFDAKAEIDFIRLAIADGKFVLGICLGAQMIGEALGASFAHSPNREIGVFPLQLTSEAKNDPIFKEFPEEFLVGHWHGDMPGLTTDSQVLATSAGCPRQIIRYTPKVYGFQCHFEFTSQSIEGMIENCSAELDCCKGLPFIQTANQLRDRDYFAINQHLFQFLNSICKNFNSVTPPNS